MWKKEAKFRVGSMAFFMALLGLGSAFALSGTGTGSLQVRSGLPTPTLSPAPPEVRTLFEFLATDDPQSPALEVKAAEEAQSLNSGSAPLEPWKLTP